MDVITPRVRIKRKDAPYSFNRLLMVSPGNDRCQILFHLLGLGITLERGGMPARYDEQPGLFNILHHSNETSILVKPTIKRSVNPLLFDIMSNMVNVTKEASALCEAGARYEAFVDGASNIKPTPQFQRLLTTPHTANHPNEENIAEELGLRMDDLDIG